MATEKDYPHLKESTKAAMALTDAERIFLIRQGEWIPYPRAKEILDDMEELYEYPRIGRMSNMLLVGASNNGKTHILKRFIALHPNESRPEDDYAVIPIIMVEAPESPDIGALYDRILVNINQPYAHRGNFREKERQLWGVLAKVKLKILIIDEIQHLIAGGQSKQREFRNALKSLGNMLEISIVVAGIEEAFNAFNTDPQLSNRFEPEILPKWKFDDEFGVLLNSLERIIPLKYASHLSEPKLAQKIYYMSEGILGEIHEVVKRAAIRAIKTGTEKITLEILECIRWTQPSKRKKMPIPA